MSKDTILVDLDGTLADIEHRRHFVMRDRPDWDAFYSGCDGDSLNVWCAELMAAMRSMGYHVYIVSARRNTEKSKTLRWLAQHKIQYDELYLLREGSDSTEDTTLKKAFLDQYGRERILFVVDDRQKVVDMWRAEGLVCLQCYFWEEHARVK